MRCSGPSLPPPTCHLPPTLRNPLGVPRPAPPRHGLPMRAQVRASGSSPPPALCPVGFPELRRFSPSKVRLLIGPGSQGTRAGTCPAVSVSPACGGSTAHSRLSETRRTHGGSEGGSPVGRCLGMKHSTPTRLPTDPGPASQWLLPQPLLQGRDFPPFRTSSLKTKLPP